MHNKMCIICKRYSAVVVGYGPGEKGLWLVRLVFAGLSLTISQRFPVMVREGEGKALS